MLRAIIVGGGIGGLSTALALHAAGVDAVVLETTKVPRPLGVGINLQPHAVRELVELGMNDALADSGIRTTEVVHFDRHGSRIWSEPRGCGMGYHWPQYSLHRGELQMMLLKRVQQRLGPSALHLGTRLTGFADTADGVRAQVVDRRSGEAGSLCGDVLIAADGLHSTVRAQLHPNEPGLRYEGIRMWRGVVRDAPFLGGSTMIFAGTNAAAKFVAYPISKRVADEGDSLINWVAEVRLPSTEASSPDWDRPGAIGDVLPYYADWSFPWLDIPGLIRNSPEVLEYPMVDRDPLSSWGWGRVSLLGDAAHPMYPVGSNGASQAIVDARVLAWELASAPDACTALRSYEKRRIAETSELVLANRTMPADRVLQAVAHRAPDGFERITDVLSQDELAGLRDSYRQTTSVDADMLNNRESWTPNRVAR